MKMGNLERNTYVREQITMATLSLLREKGIKQISIAEITERAQVSRVSFYRNYRDKEDVIKTHISALLLNWNATVPQNPLLDKKSQDDQMLASLFVHLKEHEDLYQLLYQNGLLYLLRDCLKELYGPKPAYPNLAAYITAFFSSGFYGWIEEWVARGMQESAEEMAELLKTRDVML